MGNLRFAYVERHFPFHISVRLGYPARSIPDLSALKLRRSRTEPEIHMSRTGLESLLVPDIVVRVGTRVDVRHDPHESQP